MSVVLGSLFAIIANASMADESGLYDAPLADDAAFVRFVGFEGAELPFVFDQPQPAGLLSEGQYGVISADATPDADPGQYYTVIPKADGTPEILTEPARTSTAKVSLQLLNLTDGPLSLKLADGSTAIVEGVAPGAIGAREVNPVKVPVQVFAGEKGLGDAVELLLQRGNDPTLIAGSSGITVLYSEIVRSDLTE
ncbi:MAG: alginate O-acetyltransferase AlgF [Dinoroseobacter sp.]|nr:alginate O-acetyltransferase AlgF [Dinoroseobacter sp.]